MEVLVALLLVAVGVLGFIALQLRSMDAVNEAADRTFAINIARDLAERMRINKTAFEQYKESINDNKKDGSGCFGEEATDIPNCSDTKMADFDASEINNKAEQQGHRVKIDACKGSQLNCVYVAWGDTDISTSIDTCVAEDGSYKPNTQCLVMEAY
ncbi:type IV pilus modification protein PilV [Acinetobacter thermotolerans]|uniref:type IV pilus modification protein PilV n=1 Tax=Acinetobacter thermotolerans TaxID=3151487 RepID=UPI00325B9952